MRDISSLSKIGFGTYRVSKKNPEHAEALRLALALGENLIDTANSYQNGESEKLVGDIIHEFDPHNIFIISKAGYVDKSLVPHLSTPAQKGTVSLSDTYSHCIHPDFLDQKLNESLARIKRSYIDCYMLHNPEHQLSGAQNDPNDKKASLYADIEQAFVFFENQVKAGKIRYYGISSNTFPFSPDIQNAIDLREIIKIAISISPEHHFKMIQFPFNLVENSAYEKEYFDGKSLIEIAKAAGIRTIANRPLNANIENGTIRLANNNTQITSEQMTRGKEIMGKLFSDIEVQMALSNWKEKITDFPFLSFLQENWQNIGHIQATDHIFNQQLRPFVNRLFPNVGTGDTFRQIQEFRAICEQSALSNMDKTASEIKKQLLLEEPESLNKDGLLQTILCEKYLEAGIDHVLVGMRKTRYVRDFESFFSQPAGCMSNCRM